MRRIRTCEDWGILLSEPVEKANKLILSNNKRVYRHPGQILGHKQANEPVIMFCRHILDERKVREEVDDLVINDTMLI